MTRINCPHCGEEIKYSKRSDFLDIVVGNVIVVLLPIGLLFSWLFPWTVENGYSVNWNMIIVLVFIIIYGGYATLHLYGKNKGTFLLRKKEG